MLAEPDRAEFPELYSEALEQVYELRDPRSIEALMTLIDDGADDLITFGLVHTIERFDDPVYLQHRLRASAPDTKIASLGTDTAASHPELTSCVHRAPQARRRPCRFSARRTSRGHSKSLLCQEFD